MTNAAGLHAEGADPIKLQVEATIRRVASDVLALPCHVVRAAARRVGEPMEVARSLSGLTLGGLAGRWRAAPSGPRSAVSVPSPQATPADPAPADPAPAVRADRPRPASPTPPRAQRPSATALPLDDYESLAASQVVARLERLDAVELRQVQAFEMAHRGRRTVLGKIDQLLAAADV